MKQKLRGARAIAIEILCSWEETHLPVDQIMDKQIGTTLLADPRDRQLVMSLVYGVIRWRGYLDWVLGEFSKHPLGKMKNRTLQALRIGLFQLIFLDRIPPSAAINETVQSLKDMKQPKWLTGFVNGILRSVERQKKNIPTPFNKMKLPDSARLSHPQWLIRRWKNRYGAAAAAAICLENNREPGLCLRTNSSLITAEALLESLQNEGLNAEPGKYCPLAVRLTDFHGPVPGIPGFAEGFFQVQDEAAQLVSLLLGPLKEKRSYLDGCAGLGGKTSHLAQMLPQETGLIAVEPNGARLKKLGENLARLRLDTTVTIVEGMLDSLLPEMKGKFAGVLIDAPCSGLGVIRRHPDIRWNRKESDLLRYQETQLDLLSKAAQLVDFEGILVYATCSTEPEENEEVIEKFLAGHPQFALTDCRGSLPENAERFIDDMGLFRTLPGRDDLDGFFAAKLTRIKNEKRQHIELLDD